MTFPIVNKELRTMLRSPKAIILALVLLVALGGFFVVFWADAGSDFTGRARFARMVFMMLSGCMLGGLGLISPVITATALTSEREGRTLELLTCTRLTRVNLIAGKWFSTIFFQLVLIVLVLPMIGLVFQLGGVGSDEILVSALLIATTMMTYSMIGLAISAWMRKSVAAMAASLLLILFIAVGMEFCLVILSEVFHIYRLNVGNPSNPGRGLLGYLVFSVSPMLAWMTVTDQVTRSAAGQSAAAVLGNPAFVKHLITQAAIFCGAAALAWRGLGRPALPALRPRRVIDDPTELRRRRLHFPFYLIDPLRRPQSIPDAIDPMFAKEKRMGAMARLPVMIRLSYIGMALSIPLAGPIVTSDRNDGQLALIIVGIGYMTLFAPILTASALTKEREEQTLDLLTTTTISTKRIIEGKARAAWRMLLSLPASILIIPMAMKLAFDKFRTEDVTALLFIGVMTWNFARLYGAVGLYWSSRCRRSVSAILLTYVTLFAMYLSPVIAGVGQEIGEELRQYGIGGPIEDLFEGIGAAVTPFLSPLTALGNDVDSNDGMAPPEHAWQVLAQAGVGWLLMRGLLARARRQLERRT